MRQVDDEYAQSHRSVGLGGERREDEGRTLNYKLSNLLILKATQNWVRGRLAHSTGLPLHDLSDPPGTLHSAPISK